VSWAQIRGKIVKALGPTGETIMKGLETGFDVVVALVKGGPAAAWELIKEKLTDLKDQVVSGIVGFVAETVVKKAIPKLVAMFIPGAGFISAIISIYDTIMVFVQKISKIIQVVTAFIDSIVAIAGGNIAAAANRVEHILANLLSLAISFLAGFLGLGKVTDKIRDVIQKVRGTVDKAIDSVIGWIVEKAKKLFGKLFGKRDKPDERTEEQKTKDKLAAIGEAEKLLAGQALDEKGIRGKLGALKGSYKLSTLDMVVDTKSDRVATVHFIASASKEEVGKPKQVPVAAEFLVIDVTTVNANPKLSPSIIAHKKASDPALKATPGQDGAPKGWEAEVRKQVSTSTQMPLTPVEKGSNEFPKDIWPAKGKGNFPDDPALLSQPKSNISGGRIADDPHTRPDLVAVLPGATPRLEVIEVTLDANFMIPAGGKDAPKVTEPHKSVQLAGTVFSIAGKYPGAMIVYTIRCPKKPSDFAIGHVNSELKKLKAGNIKVEVVWVWG
jgi:hypothetical protein